MARASAAPWLSLKLVVDQRPQLAAQGWRLACKVRLVSPSPHGTVPFLVCAQGALVGASASGEFFVLDPRIDADARALHGAAPMGPIGHVVAVNESVWAFPSGKNEAHVIGIR